MTLLPLPFEIVNADIPAFGTVPRRIDPFPDRGPSVNYVKLKIDVGLKTLKKLQYLQSREKKRREENRFFLKFYTQHCRIIINLPTKLVGRFQKLCVPFSGRKPSWSSLTFPFRRFCPSGWRIGPSWRIERKNHFQWRGFFRIYTV